MGVLLDVMVWAEAGTIVLLIVGMVYMSRWLRQARAQRDEALASYDRLARETFLGNPPSGPLVHGK